MAADRKTLFSRLAALGIPSTRSSTTRCSRSSSRRRLRLSLPGAHTKNLFLTDKDGRMVLVVAKDDTRVDLKALAKRLGAGRFSFGKAGAARSRARRSSRLGHAVGADQSIGGGGRRGGRPGAHGLRRGQLPSLGEHGHDPARHPGSHPLHRSLRPSSPDPTPLRLTAGRLPNCAARPIFLGTKRASGARALGRRGRARSMSVDTPILKRRRRRQS